MEMIVPLSGASVELPIKDEGERTVEFVEFIGDCRSGLCGCAYADSNGSAIDDRDDKSKATDEIINTVLNLSNIVLFLHNLQTLVLITF
jgi:hypothetical protein